MLVLIVLLLLLLLAALFFCWKQVFWVRRSATLEPRVLLKGDQYDVQRESLLALIESARQIPFEEVNCRSGDGLKLYGRYYETAPGAPLQIQFHGYRSNAIRDFSGGLQLALKLGCNVLLVDQRAHGKSGGHCLSFGVKERKDCLCWLDYARKRFGEEIPIYLVGVSMGAATVMMASDLELPENVKGIIADCGYTSPREIIRKVMAETSYPVKLVYPLVRLSGLVFGGFDIERSSARASLAKSKKPVLLIHGEDDRFVPCDMAHENYKACVSEKYIITVPGAGHGLSYVMNNEGYEEAVRGFLRITGSK